MTVKEKLQIIKNISGLTQEKLAKKLGVSFVAFNSWVNEKSKPRRNAEKNINDLYFKYTGQKIILQDPLMAKKQMILARSKKYKNILKEIIKNPDIYDQLMLSLTYNTNRLEGNTLTENETKAILFDNIALSNKSMVEHLGVKNHQAAFSYLLKYLSGSSSKIDEKLILTGFYRRHGLRIVGTYVPTANYLKVPQLMKELIKEINRQPKDVMAHVTNIHSCFEKIHPFSDGNGRVGRLIMQAMLLKENLPLAIIEQKQKRFYDNYLRRSQHKKDFLPLENFICDTILKIFKIL
jgi:Fic family protein/DNA-binding XRE family transcriptional regulator